MLRQLHDFVKDHYEQGDYEDAKIEYQKWQTDYSKVKSQTSGTSKSDYQLGYDQAIADFQKNKSFRQYPEVLIKFANHISGEKLTEVENFLKGYHDSKNKILNK